MLRSPNIFQLSKALEALSSDLCGDSSLYYFSESIKAAHSVNHLSNVLIQALLCDLSLDFQPLRLLFREIVWVQYLLMILL